MDRRSNSRGFPRKSLLVPGLLRHVRVAWGGVSTLEAFPLVLAVTRRKGREGLSTEGLGRPDSNTVDFVLDELHGLLLFWGIIGNQ